MDPRDVWVGLPCYWRHKPRGGYGFTLRIPCTVTVVHSRKRVSVRLEHSGQVVCVSPARLFAPDMRTAAPAVEVAQPTK